jgi:hypothetical protein
MLFEIVRCMKYELGVGYRRVVGVNKDDLFKRGQKQDKCLDGIPAIDSVQQFILIRHN